MIHGSEKKKKTFGSKKYVMNLIFSVFNFVDFMNLIFSVFNFVDFMNLIFSAFNFIDFFR